MARIQSSTEQRSVEFKRDKLDLFEFYDEDNILTSIQIRLEGDTVCVFVSDYKTNLKSARIPYADFKKILLREIRLKSKKGK